MSCPSKQPRPEPLREHEERVRDLKCRLHDLSAREQLLMIGARAAEVHLPEFPELARAVEYLLPDLHLSSKSCRAALVRVLFGRALHYGLIVLLLIDTLLVMAGLQIKIEVVALQGMAIGHCFSAALESNLSESLQHHHDFSHTNGGLQCVREQSEYEFAESLENLDHVFIVMSMIILCIFLLENVLFIVAFRCNYFRILFFPFDLLVVLLSLGTEILSLASPSLGQLENPLQTLGQKASISSGAVSPLIALLILGRFWRFFRIGHSVYLLQGTEEHKDTLIEEYNKECWAAKDGPAPDREPANLPNIPGPSSGWVVTDISEP
ncbi:unnamed protein product [Durusdinium trenchii]|uniref:Uncharacterized protein n=2 Tax=Durusdinium trenchii TaxID=1381693 RepID=A0ABP0S4J8_9DINO